MNPPTPYLSVIVPVHQGADVLAQSLPALLESDLPRSAWELIVVDDASADSSAIVAAEYADTVVRLPGKPHGPAYARNRGFEVARGECVIFLDADVRVHRDTLRRFAVLFAHEPDVSAAFGSYDDAPPARGVISQYRNLMHHYVHQQNPGEARTFWSGCGGVRSAVFREVGMFDEWHFPRPQIEDIELGHRLRDRGYRIVLRPEIQATHLKRWTLPQLVRTDLKDRGVPWMRLLVEQGAAVREKSLNLRTVEKLNTALVWIALACLLGTALFRRPLLLVAAGLCLLPVLVTSRALYLFFARKRGFPFAVAVVPLHLLYYFMNGLAVIYGWLLHQVVGEPSPNPTVEAFAEVGLKTWPPVPVKRAEAWYRRAERD